MMKKGKFIVIEGVDGCGGQTQVELLNKQFNGNCLLLTFPDYETRLGQIVHEFLHKRVVYEVKDVELLIYFTNFLEFKKRIEIALNSGINVIADRYVTSTIVFQTLGDEKEKISTIIKTIDLYKLPIPDITILLDITVEESQRRKIQEKGGIEKLDRNESDSIFLDKIRKGYLRVANENLLCHWKKINGMQSIEKVHEEIIEICKKVKQ